MISRSDERKMTMHAGSRPNRDDDGDEDDVTTAQESADTSDADDDDEAGDEKNETAPPHARGDAMTNRSDQDAEEASEARQKGSNMGGRGMKGGADKIKGLDISDSDEMKGPVGKVLHGRAKPDGKAAEIEGAHQGSGDGGFPRNFTNLGHGEREATIGGSHMGHGGGGGMAGEGFEAGGSLRRESAKGPSGTKR